MFKPQSAKSPNCPSPINLKALLGETKCNTKQDGPTKDTWKTESGKATAEWLGQLEIIIRDNLSTAEPTEAVFSRQLMEPDTKASSSTMKSSAADASQAMGMKYMKDHSWITTFKATEPS